MNKKIVLLAFASVFLLSAVIGAQLMVAVAAQRTVGVSEGDWAQYEFIISGNITYPSPIELPERVKNTVQEISGTNITFETRSITLYPATEETKTYFIDVDTGQNNGSSILIAPFIAANLNAGDLIYNYNLTEPWMIVGFITLFTFHNVTITETISRTYLGGNVTVNHWNITDTSKHPEAVPPTNITTSLNYYWYRASGMLAEISEYILLQQEGNTTWYKMETVIIGIIPEFPPVIILPLFMIATLTVVWLGKTIWTTKKSIKNPSPCA